MIVLFTLLIPLFAICTWVKADDVSAAPGAATSTLNLTPQESEWLRQHPQIRVGIDPAWPPFSSYNADHELVGMDVDFLKLVEARLGVTFVIVSGKSWSEVYNKVQKQDVDMLSAIALTPEREAQLNFTEPYINFPIAIITRDDAPFMIGMSQLEGQRVAVPRDYAPTLLLQRDYPNVPLVITDTTTEAFHQVSRGEVFATMDNLASASYLIKDQGLANLKVAGITNYGFALRYGVRKDWPELVGILQKAMTSISTRERNIIRDNWIGLDVDDMVSSRHNAQYLLTALIVVGMLGLFVLFWNWTLTREVERRKKAELELREARNKAVDANEMKSTFLANLSHEIRNPLDALLGFTELLKQEATDKKFQKYVDAIDAGGRTLLGVINDVLDLSKVEAGRLAIHLAPLDLRMLLRETHSLFAHRAAQKDIEFTQEVETTVPEYVLMDELRLRQILYNTVSNAIKFTERGSVRLWVAFEPDAEHEKYGVLTIKVIDTGVGIPPEDHNRIFEPFAQREGQSPLLGGTGLGLAISKRLTELMSGRVEIESQIGWGATFRFVFPEVEAVEPPKHDKSAPAGDLKDFKPLRVLLIDDLEVNRELLREYFELAGHQVFEAGDGEHGIVVARTERPDIVLLDYHLPGMNGCDAAWKLWADSATAQMPIIFISGSTGNSLEISDMINQVVVLAKPLAYSELVAALRQLLPHALKVSA